MKSFKNDLEEFKSKWTQYTQKYNCLKIKEGNVVDFLKIMEEPVGMKNQNKKEILKNILKMDLKADSEGYVYFNELLYKVMWMEYGIKRITNSRLAQAELKSLKRLDKITK